MRVTNNEEGMAMAEAVAEQTFFEYEDVKVTSARFLTGGQTYAMSNVTSVKSFVQKPKRFWPILFLIVGVIAAFAAQSPVPGIILALICVAVLFLQKTLYHVMLSTASGETSALKTKQKDYLDKVVGALNQAIVHRG